MRTACRLLPAVLAPVFLLTACSAPPAGPDAEGAAPSPEAAFSAEEEPLPAEIPRPELGNLEAAVTEQLEERRAALDALLAAPAPRSDTLAEAYGEMGTHYDAYGFEAAAAACYRHAEALAPGELRWPYLLAHTLRDRGDLEAAAGRLGRAVERRPDDLPSLVWLAQTFLDLGRPAAAEPHARRALEVDPQSAAALFLLGQVAAQQGETERAAERYEAALRIEPWASVIRYPAAVAARRLGREAAAEEHRARRGTRAPSLDDPLRAEIRGIASGSRIHLLRGTAALRAGKLEQAIGELEAAVAADPESSRARLNLGAALAQAGRLEEAVPVLTEAIPLGMTPANRSKAHFNLCALHHMTNRPGLAVQHCHDALRWDPGNEGARQRLAVLEALPRAANP